MITNGASDIWAMEEQRYEIFQRQQRQGLARRADAAPVQRRSGSRSGGIVAILPLFGVITQRSSLYGTSTESFSRNLRAAVSDSSISAIIINVDSPGGTIAGVDELSTEIYRARSQKRIVAVANSLAASAAYWIASAAESLFVTPGGEVGSIGVFAAHTDMSKALDIEGVKVTLISSSAGKVEGNPYEPLSAAGRESIQGRIDDYFNMFAAAVARNRGVSIARVKTGYGQGRVVGARDAFKAGMVDRVATLDEVIGRVASAPAQTAARGSGMSLETRMRRLHAASGYRN